MATLGRWCLRHRYVVILIWVAVLGGLGVSNSAVGSAYNDTFSLPGTESTKALDLLQHSFPATSGDTITVVWHSTNGSVEDQAVRDRMTSTLQRIDDSAHVSGVMSPYGELGGTQISGDKKTAYALVNFDDQANQLPTKVFTDIIEIGEDARTDGLQVELGGIAIQASEQGPSFGAELYVGLIAAAVVLFLAFGSLASMFLPLLTAIVALGAALFTVGVLSHAMTIGTTAPTLAALIGLGVGVDYALFIVTRHRNGIKAGRTPDESIGNALNSSGRAVLFAGGTVVVALLGLFVLDIAFISGMAVGAAVTVAFTVAASFTLLPAMLGVIGTRVLSRRERKRLAELGPKVDNGGRYWTRFSGFVRRRPALLALFSLAVMAVLIIPFFSLRLGAADQGNLPEETTARRSYDLLAQGFGPGFNGPLLLVAQLPPGGGGDATLQTLADRVKATPGIAAVSVPIPNEAGTTAILQAIPTTAPQDEATTKTIARLRDDVIPSVTQGTGVTVHVGGLTAIFDDFAEVFADKLPLFITVIVGLGCLLLLIAFRSIVVPLTAAAMNLLAAGASFGVVIAVFQWGWDINLITIGREGPIESYLPALMLAVLFGLSMDYQVFLVSRIHEEWVNTRDNGRAVQVGQAETGRIITAAATIMILVFGSTGLGDERTFSEFGIGLAVAVALDAFILRTFLVPAVMHLLGRSNWWLPGWLDRILPHASIDPPDDYRTSAPSNLQTTAK
ncbi:MMPL family transporter [Micromonospora sp. NPDC047548]|uniref:MMPL family transporter n=1 Tax=Micromonospora sp. NPDC047548 TaxID=3155624 RepID=UPI003409F3EB